jgi:chemotaxis signal transduction protein
MAQVETRKKNHRQYQRVVHLVYKDHVMFAQSDPVLLKPQTRETIGWLVYDCEDYVTISWDRNAEPPRIKGGDAKATGLVVLRKEILELMTLG